MSRPRLLLGIGAAVLLASAPAGLPAQDQAGEDATIALSERDWPCHGRFREAFSAGTFWQGPALEGAEQALGDTPEVRKLAEAIAAPDIGDAEAAKLIAGHADAAEGQARPRALALLFAALLEEANLYRRFILEGIVAMMGRRRLAAEALGETQLALDDLAGDATAEAAEARKALEQRRFWQQRALDKADGDAKFLCNRLTALEGKLGSLSRTIASHL